MRRRTILLLFLSAFCAGPLCAQGQTEEFFNPYLAEKNVEIGTYYLKKKNYDAAIERFLDAIRYKSNHALAHRRLAEAFEGKGELADAVQYYTKYLEILPSAGDADKVRKRIEKLKKEIERRAARRRGRSG